MVRCGIAAESAGWGDLFPIAADRGRFRRIRPAPGRHQRRGRSVANPRLCRTEKDRGWTAGGRRSSQDLRRRVQIPVTERDSLETYWSTPWLFVRSCERRIAHWVGGSCWEKWLAQMLTSDGAKQRFVTGSSEKRRATTIY